MADINEKSIATINRLTYIEPNEFASYFQQSKQKDGIHTNGLSWNPEDLSMTVDLQVVIPSRSDRGQVNYMTQIDNARIHNTSTTPIGRYVSYMGGVPFSDNPNSESYLTDNYTNISYQEIRNNEYIDRESLGIDSIDINFDAHFFPIVTMKFTDVRGSALFMPSEYEFDESLKNDGESTAAGSFFKALFHFPYPRFLLSIKGFYGNRVTFQLAVSDFRSDFQPDTGNYGITVQFIGYVYGLYTDLPLNLVMASPYYNPVYWKNKKENGEFTYVGVNSTQGNQINTYVEFLSKIENKDVTSEALENADTTVQYMKKKNKVNQLIKIVDCHKALAVSSVTNKTTMEKRNTDKSMFMWGRYDRNQSGFKFDEVLAKEYYEAIKDYLGVFSDAESLSYITQGNPFIESLNANGVTLDMVKKDKNNEYLPKFQIVTIGKDINEYFVFKPVTEENKEPYIIERYNDAFTEISNQEEAYKTNFEQLKVGGNLIRKPGGITASSENAITNGLFINYADFCSNLTSRIEILKSELLSEQEYVAKNLSVVFENIIGFSPSVENFYRMLFAHIDCFMDYFNRGVLGDIERQTNNSERTIAYLSGSNEEKIATSLLNMLDIPKTLTGGQSNSKKSLNVFPFPGYYVSKDNLNGARFAAEYPGESMFDRFREIREVKAVDEIIEGIKLLTEDFQALVNNKNTASYENVVFSKLSALYGGENPWKTVKLTGTDDEKDIYHLIYFFMCLLVADKAIGTKTDKQETNTVVDELKEESGVEDNLDYTTRLVNLLFDNTSHWSKTFTNSLREVRAQIENNQGDKVLENIKDYKLLSFQKKSTDGGTLELMSTPPFVTSSIPLKLDDDILTKPCDGLSGDSKKSHYVINVSDDKISGFFSLTGSGALQGKFVNEDECKDLNNKLVEIGEANEYLSGTSAIKYGDYCVSMPRKKPITAATEWLATRNPHSVHWIEDTTAIPYKVYPVATLNMEFGGYDAFDYNGKIVYDKSATSNIVDNKYTHVYTVKEDGIVIDKLKFYYTNNSYSIEPHTVNFVGRKDYGIGKIHTYYNDNYPAVNLFSGIKTYIKNGTTYYKNGEMITEPTYKESYLPLIDTDRCHDKTEDSVETQRYSFATFLLAILSGVGGLKSLCDKLNLDAHSISEPVRFVDVLYLGGMLHFQKKYHNEGKIDNPCKFHELIKSWGGLDHGIWETHSWNESQKTSQKLFEDTIEIILSNEAYDLVVDSLDNFFMTWCDDELFDSGMYDKLAFIDADSENEQTQNTAYEDYLAFCGNAAYENFCSVQGYRTGSECELWLRELTYSYTQMMIIREVKEFDNNQLGVPKVKVPDVKVSEVTRFLNKLHDKIVAEKDKAEEEARKEEERIAKEYNETLDQRRAMYYLLKNLYDKWLCAYTAQEFDLKSPRDTIEERRSRFGTDPSTHKSINQKTEYGNFVYVDQFYNDISSLYMMDADVIGNLVKDIYKGNKDMDVYAFMSFMAEKNNLLMMALPVYNNMYNAKSIMSVFRPNTLYNHNSYDEYNGIGTTYVLMYTSEVSHNPGLYRNYEYNKDYIDIADILYNKGPISPEDIGYFDSNGTGDKLNYNISAFAVSYSKQNQMYFKKVNVNMDNPKVTDESIRNTLILSEGGAYGGTDQPIAVGQNIYSIYSNRAYTCTVEMMGCSNIMPLMYFQLNNIPMFRGLYMIINVKHSIKAGDMTTTFTGVRVSRYSLPDVTDVMMNSSIFNKLQQTNLWKYGSYIENCPNEKSIDGFKTSIVATQDMKDFVKTMAANGWNKSSVCAIGGTCGAESNFKYWLVNIGEFRGEYPASSANSTTSKPYVYGAGLIQWSKDRKKTLMENVTNAQGVKLYTVHGASSVDDFLINKVTPLAERKSISQSETNSKRRDWDGGIENLTMSEQALCISYELTHSYNNIGTALKSIQQDSLENVRNATYTVYARYVGGSNTTATGFATEQEACNISAKYVKMNGERTGLEKRIAYAEWMYNNWESLVR